MAILECLSWTISNLKSKNNQWLYFKIDNFIVNKIVIQDFQFGDEIITILESNTNIFTFKFKTDVEQIFLKVGFFKLSWRIANV